MIRRLFSSFLIVWLLHASRMYAQPETPRLPPDLQDMIDAPLPPLYESDPRGGTLLLLQRSPTLPLAYLATPWVGLAGAEIAVDLRASKRRRYLHTAQLLDIATQATRLLDLPTASNIAGFKFSPDGLHLALLIDAAQGVELWLVDVKSGRSAAVKNLSVNDIYTEPLSWSPDSQKVYIAAHPLASEEKVASGRRSEGTTLEESGATKIPARTYAYLLKSEEDVQLFTRYAAVQWYEVDARNLGSRPLGEPGLYTSLDVSPDGTRLLVKRMVPPFSYAVPAHLFAQAAEIWQDGKSQKILDMPLAADVPPEGVRKGARQLRWQPDYPARLLWMEALDGGDPRRKSERRDRLLAWDAPFASQPSELARSVDRIVGLYFLEKKNQFLIRSFDPDSNQASLQRFVAGSQGQTLSTLFSYDVKDGYRDPGRLVTYDDARGFMRLAQEGSSIFLAGDGRNEAGESPFLDRLDLDSGRKERLFQSQLGSSALEEFKFFYKNRSDAWVMSREAATSPPNLWLWQSPVGPVQAKQVAKTAITRFEDSVPAMSGSERKALVYQRKDGLTMSGTLYLPPRYKAGEKLPAIVWAYPDEYRNAAVAGQVRVKTQRYARPSPTGIEWLVTQGYAVLDNASMPLIGEKESVNDTLVTQLVSNAAAVVSALDATGLIDKGRIAIGGHSYGAFMTANLLAHSSLFCAGIARSGAYNRSLTPFGFQSERRTFWEAKDFYMNVSPFYHAETIKTPLLLIHGKEDNNPGTTVLQTERMFQALRGLGAQARMVLLPYESHGYRGKDNVSLVQAETLQWLRRWCPAT